MTNPEDKIETIAIKIGIFLGSAYIALRKPFREFAIVVGLTVVISVLILLAINAGGF
jgi:hypothetical protein